ncbi:MULTISPECIES: hypothetical protein [Gammaproteobacteria]|uniref:hypothetical protein n=1 Tax=Gammaproteobacteria TaxID=1236 RepID=UPI002897264C|nr:MULTISPECIES: hypothetical protein [Gammaproteobacteria]
MNNSTPPSNGPDHGLQDQAKRCTDALKALQPKQQHRNAQLFAMLYPTILDLLGRQVTQKAILEVLQAQGLKLHPARFKELMDLQANAVGNAATSKDSK